jgi:hypothetical protein
MGANNFVAMPSIPAGLAQPSESAVVDLYAVVPPNGFATTGISVILGGDFEGAIAILGSLDGVNFRPVTLGFTSGKQVDPSRPRPLEYPPQLITDLIRYIKWKVLPNTRTFTQIDITLGGGLNCDCSGGSGFPGYGDSILPVAATNVVGVSPQAARADHQHEGVHSAIAGNGITVSSATGDVTISASFGAGAPSQIDIGDAGLGGAANTVSRSDHQHALPAPTVINAVGAASALGTSTVVAREDHTHAGVSSLTGGAGISVSASTGAVTISNTGVLGVTSPNGSITIGGTSTNPTIETTFGGAGSLSQIDIGDTASAGVANSSARIDHQHALPVPTVINAVGAASALGTSTVVAREDHTHAGVSSLTGGAGISVSAPTGAVTISNTGVLGVTSPNGSITIGGTSTNPTIETTFGGAGSLSQIDIGDTASAGVANSSARIDHQHAFPGGPAPPSIAAANSAGVATTPARSDHTHAGVTSVATNGGAAGQGAITITSPMATQTGSAVTIANANTKNLPASPVSNDIDTDVNTGFVVVKLAAASTTIPIPKVPTGNTEGRKITFKITSRGTSSDTVTWTTGAGGYLFATVLGPLLSDFNSLLAATPNNGVIKIGFEYDGALNRWVCVALAGYFV